MRVSRVRGAAVLRVIGWLLVGLVWDVSGWRFGVIRRTKAGFFVVTVALGPVEVTRVRPIATQCVDSGQSIVKSDSVSSTKCTRCKRRLGYDQFGPNSKTHTGKSHWCKFCWALYSKIVAARATNERNKLK